MKKTVNITLILYMLYGIFIFWYVFHSGGGTIPEKFLGTSADPTTFMSAREIVLSEKYSNIRNFFFFMTTPFEWMILFLLLITPVSRIFEKWARAIGKFSFLHVAIYLFYLDLATTLICFPVEWISYKVSLSYGISVQTFPSWMKELIINFWVNYLLIFLVVIVLLPLIKRSVKRWWLYAWLLSIPFTLFLTFIQPVLLDPLYHDFYPLKDKALETKILTLANQAHIPASHVYEVNMSDQTTALNAYVTGIGSNSRIVLWDTTLKALSDDEILFIMAHEMGHYVMNHVYWGIFSGMILSFIGFYVLYRLVNIVSKRYGLTKESYSIIPLILLLFSLLSFASSPLTNYVSRYEEVQADTYAVTLTQNPKAGVKTFQDLASKGLSEVYPSTLVKLFRYTHPSLAERIYFLENQK